MILPNESYCFNATFIICFWINSELKHLSPSSLSLYLKYIHLNFLICISQKKQSHMGLEWHENEWITEFCYSCNLFAIDHVGSKANLHRKTSFSIVRLIVNAILLIPNLESAVRVTSSPDQ